MRATNEMENLEWKNVVTPGVARRVVYDKNGRGFNAGNIVFYDSKKGEVILETVSSYLSDSNAKFRSDFKVVQFDYPVMMPKTFDLTRKGIFLKKATRATMDVCYDIYVDVQVIGEYQFSTTEKDEGTRMSYQDHIFFNGGTLVCRGFFYSKDKGLESHKAHWKKHLSDMMEILDSFDDLEELKKWVDNKKLASQYLFKSDYERIGRN